MRAEGDVEDRGSAEELGEACGGGGPWGGGTYGSEMEEEFGGGAGPFGCGLQVFCDGGGYGVGRIGEGLPWHG